MKNYYAFKRNLLAMLGLVMVLGLSAQLTVNTFNNTLHTGASTVTQTFANFPTDLSGYDDILMTVSLTCPTGGCDPWDRFATIKVNKNGQSYEIGRYMTPYGNGWCDWTIDVSEYRSLLTGTVELESYIETWSNGWEVSVDFEFVPGTPQYEYISVNNMWVDYFFRYGDTIFYSIDLPEMTTTVPDNSMKSVLRIVNTGHGQGGNQNAAEFSQMTHDIKVNGSNQFSQYLWKSDCNTNPCSPQSGTWQYARANWCPGQGVDPDDYDLTALSTPGQDLTLDYVLQPYFNDCSPFNPACNSGTCADCNYNSNGHTQPNYKISSQLIFYSTTPIVGVEATTKIESTLKVFPNPSAGMFDLSVEIKNEQSVLLGVYDLNGKIILEKELASSQLRKYRVDLSKQNKGMYLLKIHTKEEILYKKISVIK